MSELNQDFKHNLWNTAATKNLYKKLSKEKILTCIVVKDSEIIAEYYQNNRLTNHFQNMHSTSKSFTGALVGICMDQGLIPDVNIPITEYFGDIIRNDPDPRKQDITLKHLLTMSAGFDWPEFGEWHFFAPMSFQKDIVGFILNRNLVAAPGESMNYNSGCTHLLGAIIQKVTKTKVADFANETLFRPLNITNFHWFESHGQNMTADGLRLTTIDMLKLGYLYLNDGIYKKKQILSSEWIKESTKPWYHTYDWIGSYGYQWWISSIKKSDNTEIPFYFALGVMGQFIIAIPDLNITAAITSRLDHMQTMLPLNILKESIIEMFQL